MRKLKNEKIKKEPLPQPSPRREAPTPTLPEGREWILHRGINLTTEEQVGANVQHKYGGDGAG